MSRSPFVNLNNGKLLFSDSRPRLSASEFSTENSQHIAQLAQMGIELQTIGDGRELICYR